MAQPFLDLNAEVTEKALRHYGEQLRDGKINLAQFEARAVKEIRSATVVAFRFANGGPLNADQTAMLNNLLAEQRVHFERMVAGFRDGTIPLDHAPYRAAAYAGATTSAGAFGTVVGHGDLFLWTGPDGEASCADCGPRIGRTFTRAELLNGGMPGQMQCRGNCRCHLTPVEDAA